MDNFSIRSTIKSQAGVAMLETLISIIMLALGVLALIGLQASMNANATDAKYRAEATYLANQLVGQMWVDQMNLSRYAINGSACTDSSNAKCTAWLATVADRLPGGGALVTIDGKTVTIEVSWQTPGGGAAHKYQVVANVVS